MRLGLTRRRQEWAIAVLSDSEPRDARSFECPTATELEGPLVARTRYAFAETPETVWVRPALADRAVVVYPDAPFHVPAGENVTLVCSTPLWIRVEVGEGRTLLMEAPLERPPDTWIGPSTREGELCYATKSAARLDRAAVPRHPHRALTELRVRNRASDTLHLERVSLAVPYLSVYVSRDGAMWTEPVVLERTSGEALGRLDIGHPPVPSEVEKITPPRLNPTPGGVFVRAFSAIFD
jgi:hypothetical protein